MKDSSAFLPSPPFSSLFMYSGDYAECTHTLLSVDNKSNCSGRGKNCHYTPRRMGAGLMSVHTSCKMGQGDSSNHLSKSYSVISPSLMIAQSLIRSYARSYIFDNSVNPERQKLPWSSLNYSSEDDKQSHAVRLFSIKDVDSNIKLHCFGYQSRVQIYRKKKFCSIF